MLPIYFFGGLGLILILTLIPHPKQKLRSTINKYVSQKDNKGDFIKRVEKSIIIRLITPKSGTIRREKEEISLKRAGCKINLEQLAMIRIIIFVFSFSLVLGVYLNMNEMREKGILDKVNNTSASSIIFADNETNDISISMEGMLLNKVIENTPDYKEFFKNNKEQELAKKIAIAREELEIVDTDDVIARNVLRLLLQAYTVSQLSFSNLGVIILIAIAITGVVDVYLIFTKSIRNKKIQKDFEKIEAVIILLMNKENINVVSLLQQMKQQSKILKPYFQECLNQYTSSPTKALDDLIDEVSNNEFTKFITVLKQCLYSDKNTNNQILKIQRTLRLSLQETQNKQKNKDKRLRLTLLQLPLILFLALLAISPFLDIINKAIQ